MANQAASATCTYFRIIRFSSGSSTTTRLPCLIQILTRPAAFALSLLLSRSSLSAFADRPIGPFTRLDQEPFCENFLSVGLASLRASECRDFPAGQSHANRYHGKSTAGRFGHCDSNIESAPSALRSINCSKDIGEQTLFLPPGNKAIWINFREPEIDLAQTDVPRCGRIYIKVGDGHANASSDRI